MSSSTWTEIAVSSDLKEDIPLEAVIDDTIIVVIRHAGEVKAFQGLCPHQFSRLAKGRVTEGALHCPHHRAMFRLSDGSCGPGWDLPSLRRYSVREEGGRIFIGNRPID